MYVSVDSEYETEKLSFTLNAIPICSPSKIPPDVLNCFAAVVATVAVSETPESRYDSE